MPLREAYSQEDAAELNRLLNDLPVVVRRASELLHTSSICEPAYLAADAEVSKSLARINELMNRRHTGANDKR
jgi:hypothetical protein